MNFNSITTIEQLKAALHSEVDLAVDGKTGNIKAENKVLHFLKRMFCRSSFDKANARLRKKMAEILRGSSLDDMAAKVQAKTEHKGEILRNERNELINTLNRAIHAGQAMAYFNDHASSHLLEQITSLCNGKNQEEKNHIAQFIYQGVPHKDEMQAIIGAVKSGNAEFAASAVIDAIGKMAVRQNQLVFAEAKAGFMGSKATQSAACKQASMEALLDSVPGLKKLVAAHAQVFLTGALGKCEDMAAAIRNIQADDARHFPKP